MRGVDRLVAVGEIGARQQIQQVVGAGAADDAVGIEPERAPDRLAQLARRAVRIILADASATDLIGRDRARARPERRLVRRQLEHLGDARRAALAGHIGLDIEHAGPGLGTHRSHRLLSLFSLSRHPSGGGSAFRRDRIAGRVAADEGRGADRGAEPRPAHRRQRSMPPRSTETSKAAPSKARSGTAMTSASAAMLSTARRAPAGYPQAPHFGLGHHGVGRDARNHENRHGRRMIGALDERQPRDDFRSGSRIRAPSTMGRRRRWRRRERGRDRLLMR